MARVYTFPRFLGHTVLNGETFEGGGAIPASRTGKWVGFAIGQGSDVDMCRVNGSLLAVGGVLPTMVEGGVQLRPVRGPQTEFNDAGGTLEIVAFECGDTVAPTGLRSPKRAFDVRDWNGVAAWTRVIRVPTAGRKAAIIRFRSLTANSGPLSYKIIGRSYHLAGSYDPASAPIPHAALIASGTHTHSTDANTAQILSTVQIVGGTDNFEQYDELEVWASNGGAAAAWPVTIDIEAIDSAEGF